VSDLVLDTHALVWWLEGNRKLPPALRAMLDNLDVNVYLTAIVKKPNWWIYAPKAGRA